MSGLLIRGGRVLDPARGADGVLDVLLEDGLIRAVAPDLQAGPGVETLDARGKLVVPGLIDMHVHLREPGVEADETIASGSAAAVRGGFTAVAAMPTTDPAVDGEAAAEFQVLQGKRAGKARIYPIGAATRAHQGEALAELEGLVRGGAVAFSDGDRPIRSAEVLRCALLYARMLGRTMIVRPEDPDLAKSGVMHSGVVSLGLGLPGKSSAAEEIMVGRDIALARLTQARLHFSQVSTRGAVDLIRAAKREGLPVTCAVTPHHLTLTDERVRSFDPNFKVDPPLRTQDDLEALVEGIRDGTIDAIVSNHSPHSREKKEVEFQVAPSGVIGLETTLPIAATALVHQRGIAPARLVELLSVGPARILGLEAGSLAVGAPADVTVLDLEDAHTVGSEFRSNSQNSPFVGWEVRGRAHFTIVAGRVVYALASEGAAQA